MALRLLHLLNRRVKGKPYKRWRIGDLPDDVIAELGWTDKLELDHQVKGDTLVLRPARKQ